MKRLGLTLLSLTLMSGLYAQSNETNAASSTTRLQSYYKSLRNSDLKFDVSLTSETIKDDNKVIGTDNVLDLLFRYKFNAKNSLRLNPSIEYVKVNNVNPAEKDVNEYYFSNLELTYKRSLLTADKNFINLGAELRTSYIPNQEMRDAYLYDGSSQARLTASKSFGNFNLMTIGRYEVFTRRTGAPTTLKSLTRVYLIPSYQVTEKLGFSSTLYWSEYTNVAATSTRHQNLDDLNIQLSADYSLGRDLSVSAYTIVKTMRSGDNHFINDDWNDKATFGLNLNLVVF